MVDEPSAWICTECGEIADGDMCMKCGNTREDPGPPVAPAALQFGLLARPFNRLAIPFGLVFLVAAAVIYFGPMALSCGR